MSEKSSTGEGTPPALERKLAAIFSTDVKGYSRLMGDDEEATIHTLKTYREVITSLIEQHHGRVVDSPGDNMLAEFASAVDAVKSAVAIQHELKTRNAELAAHRKMEFRIGLNVGDVIADEGRLYGDGVNIAARIESLAEGGGISVSANVHEQVKNKLDLVFTFQGEQVVKNIADPVRVYQVVLNGDAPVFLQKKEQAESSTALPLPDKPSIAVLPFTNMSDDPAQEYFSDGMTDDIITDLSKISGLFVIARNSTFTYKGQAVKVAEVGRELGVRHVLEGSVRKAGNQVRINAQLIDATTGGHVWADRYDRELKDIFVLQDEITREIVTALEVKLTKRENQSVFRRTTNNLAAYDFFLRGITYFYRYTPEANAQARQMFARAIELDAAFAEAYAWLGFTHWIEWVIQWTQDAQAIERALELAHKALALEDSFALPHLLLGSVYSMQKQHEQALAASKKAIECEPNFATAYGVRTEVLNLAGRYEEALEMIEQAHRLDPHPSLYNVYTLGWTYLMMRRYEKAIPPLKQAVTLNPDYMFPHLLLAIGYGELDRPAEAQAAAAEVLRTNPQFSAETIEKTLFSSYEDRRLVERWVVAMRQAGLK